MVPEDAGFYLVSRELDAIAEQHAETILAHLEDRLKAIEVAHGVEEGDLWEPVRRRRSTRRASEAVSSGLGEYLAAEHDAHGEHAMAVLFRADREEYKRRSDAGRQFFFGSEPADESDASDFLELLFDGRRLGTDRREPDGAAGLPLARGRGLLGDRRLSHARGTHRRGRRRGCRDAPASPWTWITCAWRSSRLKTSAGMRSGGLTATAPSSGSRGSIKDMTSSCRVLAEAPEGEEPRAKLRLPQKEPE